MLKQILPTILIKKPLRIFIFIISLICLFSVPTAIITPQDFCQDYYAAQYFKQHKSIYAQVPCGKLKYNAHPPIATLLFLPFTFFSFFQATFLWGIFLIIS